MTLVIRPLQQTETILLKDFAPPEWNSDLSLIYSFHFGRSYFHPIVAEQEGRIVGCAEGLVTGKSGWLGNIIVLPECRGQGIGSALTSELIDILYGRGCTSLTLTATKLGEPIYRKLGFVEQTRYVFLSRETALPPETVRGVRAAEERDHPAILAIDRQATGEERSLFIQRFMETARVYQAASGTIEGYYLPALRHGPVIAANEKAGLALLQFKLAQGDRSAVVPSGNRAALDFLAGLGFKETSTAPRMILGAALDWKPTWIFNRGAGYCG